MYLCLCGVERVTDVYVCVCVCVCVVDLASVCVCVCMPVRACGFVRECVWSRVLWYPSTSPDLSLCPYVSGRVAVCVDKGGWEGREWRAVGGGGYRSKTRYVLCNSIARCSPSTRVGGSFGTISAQPTGSSAPAFSSR